MTRARSWAVAGSIAAVAVTVGTRFWLGTDDWAGLGQWIGGLGSFAAVAAALWIAGAEARHERAREAERIRVHAYYVTGNLLERQNAEGRFRGYKLEVANRGTDPVLDVEVVALHPIYDENSIKLEADPVPVLIPSQPWVVEWEVVNASDTPVIHSYLNRGDELMVEIVFSDMTGNRWRRMGNQSPTPEPRGRA